MRIFDISPVLALGAAIFATGVLAASCADETDEPASGAEPLTVCPATNVIVDPPQFQWTYNPPSATNPTGYYSGSLEMGSATFLIGGQTFTTRAYRQAGTAYTIPGPTIKMVPGNKYVLRFANRLPYQPASSALNVFKDPNVTKPPHPRSPHLGRVSERRRHAVFRGRLRRRLRL